MIQEELIPLIAKRIKALRTEKSLTLQTLSERTNLTKGLISKIENSRTIPSVPVLFNLMNALEIKPQDFFDPLSVVANQNYLHIKRKEYKHIKKENRPGFDYRFILAQSLQGCTMETVLLTIKPKAKSKPTTTDGFEFKYIVSGDCDYYIKDEKIELREGDSIYFDASKPHYPINNTKRKVVMLVIYYLTIK
ncbi:MAG: helix-turn-helix domain-containing protein [Cyclobacteriaceae bacterium]